MHKTVVAVALWVTTWLCFAPYAGAQTESEAAAPRGKWALTAYGGIGTDGGIEDIPGAQAAFNDAYMLTVACSREVAWWGDWMAFEVEGQLAQHFAKQDHWEANLLLIARWIKFPWNDFVRTSVAVGDGISYVSSIPEIEEERSPGETSKLLNYMLIELELAPPKQKHWSFVARIHHRSGVYGLFNGVSTGSNIVGFGVKYRF